MINAATYAVATVNGAFDVTIMVRNSASFLKRRAMACFRAIESQFTYEL